MLLTVVIVKNMSCSQLLWVEYVLLMVVDWRIMCCS